MTEPTPREAPTPPDHDEPSQTIRYANTAESLISRLAKLARTLKEGQYRLFLTLAELTEADPHHSVVITARELCKLAPLALSAFPPAQAELEKRGLITVRHGNNHRPSRFKVNFFDTTGGSPKPRMPHAQQEHDAT